MEASRYISITITEDWDEASNPAYETCRYCKKAFLKKECFIRDLTADEKHRVLWGLGAPGFIRKVRKKVYKAPMLHHKSQWMP